MCHLLQPLHATSPKAMEKKLIFGRAGASPPSRCVGDICPGDATFWSPRAPALRANVKPARSHPVTCMVKRGKTYCLVSWRVTSKSWLVCWDSRFGLPLSLASSTLGAQLPFAASLRAAKASY